MSGYGYHYGPCRGGGGGRGLVLAAAAVVVLAAMGAGSVAHVLAELAEIAAAAVGVLVLFGVAAAVVVWRVRRRRVRSGVPVRALVMTARVEPARQVGGRAPAAIEAPRPRGHTAHPWAVCPHRVPIDRGWA